MPKPSKPSELVIQTRAELVKRFPMCFRAKGTAKSPLKIGIRDDLYRRCEDIPQDLLRKALSDYCFGPSYQVALLKTGEPRLDLDGDACGVVTEIQSALAATRLRGRPPHAIKRWLDEVGAVLPEKKNPAEACAATG